MYEIKRAGPGKNALGFEMMQFVADELVKAGNQPVLLTGDGDSFSAGLNLKEVLEADSAGMDRFLRLLNHMTLALYTHPAPTVAWVNGHAIAGGTVLALCCDYRIGTRNPKSRLGLNEVAIGLRFPPMVLAIVRAQLAQPHTDTILLGAELHGSQEAQRLGILHELADDADGLERARARLALLGSYERRAYAGTKLDLRGHVVREDPDAEAHYALDVLPMWTSPAIKAKILAILKR